MGLIKAIIKLAFELVRETGKLLLQGGFIGAKQFGSGGGGCGSNIGDEIGDGRICLVADGANNG